MLQGVQYRLRKYSNCCFNDVRFDIISILPKTKQITLNQRFSIPVLAPHRSTYFSCLSLLTHLIQIISSLEVRSMNELCSDWHAPYTVSIAPYSLSRGKPLKFTSLQNIHSWICVAQHLYARTSVTSYTSVNIYNFNSRLAHFNALWMEYVRFELESWRNIVWCPLRRALAFE